MRIRRDPISMRKEGEMSKKIFAVLLVSLMLLVVTSCNKVGYHQNKSRAQNNPLSFGGMITVISREPGSGTREAFTELFDIKIRGSNGSITDTTTQEAVTVNSTAVVLQSVAANPQAIGYISLASFNDEVKALKVNQVAPSMEAVLDGSYQVVRPFIIAVKRELKGLAADFIAFILSREGQKIVATSYVPAIVDAAPYQGHQASGKIVVGGSSSVISIMERLREAYLARNPAAQIEIHTSDSTAGMTNTISGVLDIGLASREIQGSEAAELMDITIARDSIVLIVNPQNPIENLTSEEIKAIFTGGIESWEELLASYGEG